MAEDEKTRVGFIGQAPIPTLRDIDPINPEAPGADGQATAKGSNRGSRPIHTLLATPVPSTTVETEELSQPEYIPSLNTGVGNNPKDDARAYDEEDDDGKELFVERYKVIEQLGEGGMGQVYRVKCLRLGKEFALKRMHGTIAGNQELRDLFYREARLASSLTHPNIISIVDYGEDENYGAFMVMELAQGEPLTQRLATGPMPIRTMTDVVLQIADALKHIHSKGIVHGDIKPDNILLHRAKRSDRRRWEVMLLDFGLATLRSGDEKEAERVSGTPPYMAPERIQGVAPTPSQDIYALGILAYQLTTGQLPFNGSITQVLTAHVMSEAPPFSKFLDSEVDPRLEALIFKAIAKDPAERHKDMAAFIYELRTLVDMLGLGRKRGGFKQLKTNSGADPAKDRAMAIVHRAFHSAPIPMAMVTIGGTIEAANDAFVRFLGRSSGDDVVGETVITERFARIMPTLAEDLREAHESQSRCRKAIEIKRTTSIARLYISFTPGTIEEKSVLITVQSDNR